MTLMTREQLQSLVESAQAPCVSIFLPTHRAGAEIQQDRIRLKNLLRDAERELAARGVDRRVAGALLEPAAALYDDEIYWQHQSDGLALFLSPNTDRSYRVPLAFEELVVVNDRFHLTPLLPLLTGDGRFYVLALSQKRVRLLEGNRDGLREVDLRDIPESLADAVGYDYEQRSLQFHTGGKSGTGAGPKQALFHGHGVGNDDLKEEVEQFVRRVDGGLARLLDDRQAPLVLAAVERIAAMYREATKHPNVVAETVEGNPDELSPQELHARAWRVVEPHFRAEQDRLAERYRDLLGSDLAKSDLETVVPAAADGRVAALFVPLEAHRWGRFDAAAREVEVRDRSEGGAEDLIDRAAFESLFHGGTVFAVPPGDVPGDGPVAAVLRY